MVALGKPESGIGSQIGRKYGKNAEKLRAYVRSKVGQAMARAGR